MPYMSYYSVIVFYQLDLPIFSETFNFKVSGDTRLLSSSYRTNGYYKTGNGLCQKYVNGKKSGNPISCSSLNSGQIIGG
jgi:hypothetical protein